MKIEESDHEIYQGWNWASQSTFFGEVVQFLKAEEVQVGNHNHNHTLPRRKPTLTTPLCYLVLAGPYCATAE